MDALRAPQDATLAHGTKSKRAVNDYLLQLKRSNDWEVIWPHTRHINILKARQQICGSKVWPAVLLNIIRAVAIVDSRVTQCSSASGFDASFAWKRRNIGCEVRHLNMSTICDATLSHCPWGLLGFPFHHVFAVASTRKHQCPGLNAANAPFL